MSMIVISLFNKYNGNGNKIQIDVIGKLENSQFVKCKLYIDGEATPILMPETEYQHLIQEGFLCVMANNVTLQEL